MTQQPNRPWQPIDTAPDDGTEIQVSWADNNNQRVAWRVRGLWFNLGAFYIPPDFWRPMPPGPGETPENTELSYRDIDLAIRAVPQTQLPGLMIACIETGVDKGVWREYWIEIFAARIEREYRQKLSNDAEESHE